MSLLSLTRLWFSVSRELGCGWRGFVQTLHHSDQQAAWERGYSAPGYIRLWVWWQRAEKTWCANHFQHLEHREVIKTLFPSALSIHQLAAQGEVSQVAAHLSKGEGSGHKADPTFLSFFFFVNWNVRKFLHPPLFCRQLTAQQTGWTGLHSSHVGGSVRREGSGGFSPGEG